MIKKLLKDEKGVFGLNAVQEFFVIILGIALLAFVIVIIMGTLSGTTILPSSIDSATENNKYVNNTGYTLGQSSLAGFSNAQITSVVNATDGLVILSGNYTLTNNIISNATVTEWENVNITYSYKFFSEQQKNLDHITGNTSEGITGFFSSISPVYAILAVLVIILVLVVLVRVVQTPAGSKATPQL